MNEKIPVIAVVGPTASGKTALAIELAKKYGGEIVSADSMQIYKGMDIATAKPTKEELSAVPHHLIGFLDHTVNFSVADYLNVAHPIIADIYARGKMPIVAGGTGLYISSLLENIVFAETKSDENLRHKLENEAKECGGEAMLKRLDEFDHETAVTLHPNNLPRIIRAIEVYELTGKTMSEYRRESRLKESDYNSVIIGLTFSDRQTLYNRINIRVDEMIKNGLIDECSKVYENYKDIKNEDGRVTFKQAIGYKELIPYFERQQPLDECIEKIKMETRRYAKRQLTWFRKNEKIHWIMLDEFDTTAEILCECEKYIAKVKIM